MPVIYLLHPTVGRCREYYYYITPKYLHELLLCCVDQCMLSTLEQSLDVVDAYVTVRHARPADGVAPSR